MSKGLRVRKKLYGRSSTGSSGGGGGPAGGAAGSVQYNNGGSLAGFGSYNGASTLDQLPPQMFQVSGTNKKGSVIAVAGGDYFGALLTNIIGNLPSIPNNSVVTLEVVVSSIRKDVAGTSGFAYKVRGAFRKNSAGTISEIGASAVDWTLNDTGDSFTVQELLTSGADITVSTSMTTVKTLAPLLYSIDFSIISL